jgi:hypothetical protein
MSDLGPSPYSDPIPSAPQPASSPFGESPYTASSYSASSFGAPPPPPPSQMLYELRPLSLGEILDRSFSLYRRRFWMFVGLSSIIAATSTLTNFAKLSYTFHMAKPPVGLAGPGAVGAEAQQVFISLGISLLQLLLNLLAYSLTQSATISAISAVYLGEETSIGGALRIVKKHWFRYILIVLWQFGAALWLPFVLFIPAVAFVAIPSLRIIGVLLLFLVFASVVYSVIAYIRNSLGIAAATVEDLNVRAAMRRSKFLVAGHKGRVFVIGLLMYVLYLVAGIMAAIPAYGMLLAHGVARSIYEAVLLLISFITSSLISPVGAIALCLFYIDERVRKEGFDLEVLMQRGAPPPPSGSIDALPSPFTSELT